MNQQLQQGKGFKKEKPLAVHQSFPYQEKDLFVVRFDHEDQYLAAGFNNGTVQVYNLKDSKLQHELQAGILEKECPVTCLRWRNKSKFILVSASSDGSLIHWHAPSGKVLHRTVEEDNSILALDFNYDGSIFATSGKDFNIRIYDDNIKSVSHVFPPADWLREPEGTLEPRVLVEVPAGHAAGGDIGRVGREHPDVGHQGEELHRAILRGVALGRRAGLQRAEADDPHGLLQDREPAAALGFPLEEAVQERAVDRQRGGQQVGLRVLCPVQVRDCVGSIIASKCSNEVSILAGCSGVHEVKLFDKGFNACASLIDLSKGVYSVDYMNTQSGFAFGDGSSLYVMRID